jgi:hypothetical protein
MVQFYRPLTNERRAVVVHLEFCPNQKCKKTVPAVELCSMRRVAGTARFTIRLSSAILARCCEAIRSRMSSTIPARLTGAIDVLPNAALHIPGLF